MSTDDYALWAQIADAAAKKKVRAESIQVTDPEFQSAIQRVAEKKEKPALDVPYILDRPILGKILVLPRSAARLFTYDKPWACISIADVQEELPRLNLVQRVDLLRLLFEDLDAIPSDKFREAYPHRGKNLFSEEQAKQILEFAAQWWNEVDLLMLHCYAGISRSAAVGKALSDIYQPEWSHCFDEVFTPNTLVYETIKQCR